MGKDIVFWLDPEFCCMEIRYNMGLGALQLPC